MAAVLNTAHQMDRPSLRPGAYAIVARSSNLSRNLTSPLRYRLALQRQRDAELEEEELKRIRWYKKLDLTKSGEIGSLKQEKTEITTRLAALQPALNKVKSSPKPSPKKMALESTMKALEARAARVEARLADALRELTKPAHPNSAAAMTLEPPRSRARRELADFAPVPAW